jgi:SAM-dependent methyltransferase
MARGLPDAFAPAEKGYALYEDVDYREFWKDPEQTRQDVLEKHLIAEMLPATGHRLIDVGCGYARLAPLYLGRFNEVVLLDGSMSLLRQAHETYGDAATYVAGDAGNLPFADATFDCLLTIRVLHHLHDLEGALAGMGRVLEKDGRMVFSYHNKRNARRMLEWAVGQREASPFDVESAETYPTLLSHHPVQVERYLGHAGFYAPEYQGAVVLNALARASEAVGIRGPSGMMWSRFTGRHLLAPWLIGSSTASNRALPKARRTLDESFKCPACAGAPLRDDSGYLCQSCGREYPIADGIIDFRL